MKTRMMVRTKAKDANDDEDNTSTNQTIIEPNKKNQLYRYDVPTNANNRRATMVNQPGEDTNPVIPTVASTNSAPNAIWIAIDNQMQEAKVEKQQFMILYLTIYFPRLSL